MRATQNKRRRSSGSNPRKKQNTSEKTPVVVAPKNVVQPAGVVKAIGATVTTTTADAGPSAARAKPANPWRNRTRKIPDWWGTTYHDISHFSPTMGKPYHGVWGTKKVATVYDWVTRARDAVNKDDEHVVQSKPGTDGGYNFLVDMREPVGYMSGSRVPLGTQPQATHVAVYLDAKGNVATVFPCTPDAF
jgi:hypothetical protein